MKKKNNDTQRITITLPKNVFESTEKIVEQEMRSRSNFISVVLTKYIEENYPEVLEEVEEQC